VIVRADPFTTRGLLRAMTPADAAVSLALVIGAILAPRVLSSTEGDRRCAVVTVGRREAASLDLSADRETVVRGRVGDVRIRVEDGAVRIVASTCPQHLCLAAGAKSRAGEVIACVPNELLVRIVGGPPDSSVPDAVTR
jgi:hypothetical protein